MAKCHTLGEDIECARRETKNVGFVQVWREEECCEMGRTTTEGDVSVPEKEGGEMGKSVETKEGIPL